MIQKGWMRLGSMQLSMEGLIAKENQKSLLLYTKYVVLLFVWGVVLVFIDFMCLPGFSQ